MNHYSLPTSGKSWIWLICRFNQTICELFYCHSFRSALNIQTQLATTVCFTAGSLSILLRLGKGRCEFWHWWCYFWLKNGGPPSTARRKRAVDGGLTCWCSVFRGAAPSTRGPLPLWLPRCRIHVTSALPLPPDRACYWIGHDKPATKSLRRKRRERNTWRGQLLLERDWCICSNIFQM